MAENNRVIRLTRKLISINSENPPGNEYEIARFVKRLLKEFGFSSEIIEFSSKRSNLVCRVKSKYSREKILLTPHLDTVPSGGGWKFNPFSGKIHKSKIYGRGASDCKGNLAVCMEVLSELKEEKQKLDNLDIIFAASADEEAGSGFGLKPLLERLGRLDYAVVLDGDEFEVIYGQKGLLHLRVIVKGKKAHGAFPERGINAIEKALEIIKGITLWVNEKNQEDKTAGFTLNIGKISGGERVNVVADNCSFDADIRFARVQDKRKLLDSIKKIARFRTKNFSLSVLAFQNPVSMDRNSLLFKILKSSLARNKCRVRMKFCRGATVLNFLERKGIPSCVFGAGSKGQAHTSNEYAEIKKLTLGVKILKDFLIDLDKKVIVHNSTIT